MGAINYKTSDFITVGYNCNNIDYDDEFYNEFINDCYEQAEILLKKQHFYYFHITIEPGYYEGFSIDIENNFAICFDSYEDKQLAQKEITSIKEFLSQCINYFDCCVVYPGWCTGYENYENSIKKLKQAIQEMRETVKDTPTFYTYQRQGA